MSDVSMELPSEPKKDFHAVYLLLGMIFGVVATQSEIISWFRIQEMFRFHSFHMYGVIGSAVLVGALSVAILRRFNPKALSGDSLVAPEGRSAALSPRLWLGGLIFGLGWGLVGACPGPIFALLGHGLGIMVVVLAAAMAGTLTYSWLRPYLPH